MTITIENITINNVNQNTKLISSKKGNEIGFKIDSGTDDNDILCVMKKTENNEMPTSRIQKVSLQDYSNIVFEFNKKYSISNLIDNLKNDFKFSYVVGLNTNDSSQLPSDYGNIITFFFRRKNGNTKNFYLLNHEYNSPSGIKSAFNLLVQGDYSSENFKKYFILFHTIP